MKCAGNPRGAPEGLLGKCGMRPGPFWALRLHRAGSCCPPQTELSWQLGIPGLALLPPPWTLRLARGPFLSLLGPLGQRA